MLMRFDPFTDFDRLAQRFFGGLSTATGAVPMDAWKEGDHFVVKVDLPGIDPGSVDVTVEKNVLTISAERSWQPGEGAEIFLSERPHGTFRRQLFLGESVDTEHVQASYDQGVLTVTIPLRESAKPRRVEIAAGDSAAALAASTS